MEIFIAIIILTVMLIVFLATTGYGHFDGITLELDEMYTNTNEMARAVLEELKKQRRECELIEMGKGFPIFLIDGKKYVMTYKMTSASGLPVQVIQLKICKEQLQQ